MKFLGQRIDLLILDLDGVILDLFVGFGANLRGAAARLGLSAEPVEQYLVGVRSGRKPECHIQEWPRNIWPNITQEEVRAFICCFREEEQINPYPPVEGSIGAILWFRSRAPVALCTGNDRETTERRLRGAEIDPAWFVVINTSDDEYSKPDPRALEFILAETTADPQRVLYVGDWYPDIEMAKKAGVPFVAVLSGDLPWKAFLREGVPPTHIFERLDCLAKQIRESPS